MVKSVSRGDCEWQGGKILRLLSKLRPRIRHQFIYKKAKSKEEDKHKPGIPYVIHVLFYKIYYAKRKILVEANAKAKTVRTGL